MKGNQTVKVDENVSLQAQQLLIELGWIQALLDEWIIKANKILPARCQRFERAASSLSLKMFRLGQLYNGVSITGVLPDQQNHNGCKEWG